MLDFKWNLIFKSKRSSFKDLFGCQFQGWLCLIVGIVDPEQANLLCEVFTKTVVI